MAKKNQLTPKEARFAEEYLVDLNATQAAIRAGYSAKTAQTTGSQVLGRDRVAARVAELAHGRAQKTGVTAEVVLENLLRIINTDLGEAFDENGSLKPIHEIPEDIRRAMSGVEIDDMFEGKGESREHVGYTKKVKFWDKIKALELLGKHLKLFIDRVEVTTDDELAEKMAKAERRMRGGGDPD